MTKPSLLLRFWDFLTLRPESVNDTMFVFGDRGIPDGFAHMDGFSINTYKMVNSDGVPHYVKIHMKTNQGIKVFSLIIH